MTRAEGADDSGRSWRLTAMLATTLGLILASLLSLGWLVEHDRDEEIQEWRARLGAMATDRGVSVDRWLRERTGDAELLAAEAASGRERTGPDGIVPQLDRAVRVYGYAAAWLVAGNGSVVASSSGAAPPSPAERRLAEEAVRSGRPGSRFFTEPERRVSFAAPRPGSDGAVLLRADPDRYLFPLLESEYLPTRTGETLLLRIQGNSVVFLSPQRKAIGPAERAERARSVPRLATASAFRGDDAFGDFIDHRGTAVLAATRALDNAPWGVVVKVDRSEAMAEHREQRWIFLLSALGLVVGIVTASAAYGYRVRSKEKLRAAAAIRRNETRLRTILDTITEAVVVVEPDGTVSFANPAAEDVLGITPSEAVGQPLDDPGWKITAVEGESSSAEGLPFARIVSAGSTVREVRYTIERPDGTPVVLSVNAAPILEEDDLQGMVTSIQDVTERTRAEREIQRLNRELEERVRRRTAELAAANEELEAFAYSVSHDLRAPLRALDGFSQALVEDYGDRLGGEALDFLERIRSNSQKMAQLIDDILQLSRVSRRELERREVDLVALAREALESLRDADGGREVDVHAPPHLVAEGDPRLLRIVVENLIGNAWKFTQRTDDPRIELGAGEHEEGRMYYVRDNGVGFESEYIDKLFQPFQRLHSESEFEGTGIGLATVSRIVRRHGGAVRAEGEVGHGATIWFSLGERVGEEPPSDAATGPGGSAG